MNSVFGPNRYINTSITAQTNPYTLAPPLPPTVYPGVPVSYQEYPSQNTPSTPQYYYVMPPGQYAPRPRPVQRKSNTSAILMMAAALTVTLGVAVASSEQKKCREDDTCSSLISTLGTQALLDTKIIQETAIKTPLSETLVLNLSSSSIDISSVKNATAYYETNARNVIPTEQTVATNPGEDAKPKKVMFVGIARKVAHHILLLVDKPKDMPTALLGDPTDPKEIPAGFTVYSGDDTTLSIVTTPIAGTQADGLNQTAEDVIKTELCQATIDVIPAIDQRDALTFQLGQETGCNNAGLAMQFADEHAPFQSYTSTVQASIIAGGAAVGYNNQYYRIYTQLLSQREYNAMEKALS